MNPGRIFAGVRRLNLSPSGVWLLVVAVATVTTTAVIAAGVGEDVTQHNGAATSDPQHLRFFVEHRPTAVIAVARGVTALGAVPVLGILAIVAAALLWWKGQRLFVALAPGIAFGGTGVAVAVTKQLVGRVRPDLAVRLVSDSEASFPSGHAADSTALFVAFGVVVAAVLFRRPLARVVTVAVALIASAMVGLSRLVLAAHWPTDVIAGWAVGLLIGVTISTIAVLAARVAPSNIDRPSRVRARVTWALLARRRGVAARPFAA